MPPADNSNPNDYTLPPRQRPQDESASGAAPAALPTVAPWMLQHYFDGEIDLIKELVGRFPQIPVMSLFSTREVGRHTRRGVATIATQDGAANVIVELDIPSRGVQFTFVLSSMLALRFIPGRLTDMDRTQWLEPMRREAGEVAFLWDQSRWQNDYLIGAAHRTYTNLFAFSPHHIEAAVRLTPEVGRKLLDWLESYWDNLS